jgi:2-phospho-L-lactate guanylyltransferase
MRVIALPVKSLDEAKSRLGPMLSPLERAALTLAMLEDVLDATLALGGWETWVISPDEAVLEVAARRGGVALLEERPTLASAIAQLEEQATARGADVLAILLPDTPFVTAAALTAALHTLGPVVLASSTDESGTNLLVRRPPSVIPAGFGRDSYRRHLEAAAEVGVPTAVVDRPELTFDLDRPEDILTVLRSQRRGRTREVCRDLHMRARLATRA